MGRSKSELQVGLFVFVCLILLAVLLVSFGNSRSWFTPVYQVRMKSLDVGGMRKGASVAMLGVHVGQVAGAHIAPDGQSVTVLLEIESRFQIRSNARFSIDQSGFLGDQFVSIVPGTPDAPFLRDGDEVSAAEPFNLVEMGRSATGLLQEVDAGVRAFNRLMERLDRVLLNDATLNHVAVSAENLRAGTGEAVEMLQELRAVVAGSAPALSNALQQVSRTTERLDQLAADAGGVLEENREAFRVAVHNLENASTSARELLAELQAGKGIAGDLLKSESLREEIRLAVSNLQVAASNVANYGLLYRPRKPRPPVQPAPTIYPGKSPFKP